MNANVQTVTEELAANFELFDDWDERYEYITELGNKLARLAATEKNDATKVHPCMSNVYVVGDLIGTGDGVIQFRAECDTAVIRGVIALLVKLYSGHSPEAALAIDADEFFDRLGLFEHLSPTRHVGIYAIVERFRAVAEELQAQRIGR